MRSRLYEPEIEKRQAATRKLDETKLDISFGSQIRTYTLQPYRLVKDHRTKFEMGDVDRVLDGDLDPFIRSFLAGARGEGHRSREARADWRGRQTKNKAGAEASLAIASVRPSAEI